MWLINLFQLSLAWEIIYNLHLLIWNISIMFPVRTVSFRIRSDWLVRQHIYWACKPMFLQLKCAFLWYIKILRSLLTKQGRMDSYRWLLYNKNPGEVHLWFLKLFCTLDTIYPFISSFVLCLLQIKCWKHNLLVTDFPCVWKILQSVFLHPSLVMRHWFTCMRQGVCKVS